LGNAGKIEGPDRGCARVIAGDRNAHMTVYPQCFECGHYRGLVTDEDGLHNYVCEAFPKRIPDEILFAKHVAGR
jgi:hypothetical protein